MLEATDWKSEAGKSPPSKRRSDYNVPLHCSFLRPLDAGRFSASDFQSVAFQSVASASIRGSQSAALNFQSVNDLLVPALVKPFIAEIIGMVPGWPHLGNKAVAARNFVDVLVPADACFPIVATMHMSKSEVSRMRHVVTRILHLKRGIDSPKKARNGRIPNADQLNIKSIIIYLRVKAKP